MEDSMSGISNLQQLLQNMKPELIKGTYVFCTLSPTAYSKLQLKPVMLFQEKEGITLILETKTAIKNRLQFSGEWNWITLTVHSDLAAVGFLAATTKELAAVGISVNAVSAYYHDHLFVPKEKARHTFSVLKKFTK